MTTSAEAGRRAGAVALVVATAIALVWTFWPEASPRTPDAAPPAPQQVVPGTVLASNECAQQAAKPFRPTRISIKHVARDAEVLAMGRDSANVPQAPSLTSEGKTQFAWDDASQQSGSADTVKPPGAMPGSAQGNVLMNAHTWPDGSAMGNKLLDNLQVGDRIVLGGKGAELCYEVTRRIVIRAADGSHEYYEQDGPPQLALIVCSPPRLGPGNWENRTIWFASPIGAAAST